MFKSIVLGVLAFASFASCGDCTLPKEIKCLDDINSAYPICDKAAESKGKDVIADLQCMKYFYKMEQDCWPCICYVANKQDWKIKGCNSLRLN